MIKRINYLIIFQLFLYVGTAGFNTALAEETEDEENECSQGEVYNTGLNRCVLSTDTVESKTAANNCEGLDGDEFKECFNKNVDKELADAEAKDEIKEKTEAEAKYGIPAVATIASAYLLWDNAEALEQCGQTSMWLMLGGGVSSLLGEYMAQSSYEKDTKGLIEKYKELMSDKPEDGEGNDIITTITDNQKVAFDFQIEQEKARKDAHEARKKAYNLSFGLYTASALASVYDMFMGGKGCETANYSSPYMNKTPVQKVVIFKNSILLNKEIFGEYYFIEELKQIEIQEIVMRKLSGIFTGSAYAAAAVVAGEGGFMSSIKGVASEAGDFVGKAIQSPTVRAAVGGILAGYSKKIAGEAGDHAKESGARIKLLEELKASFISNGGAGFTGCAEDERDDSSKPNCYCYNSDGSHNSKRSEQAMCKALYADAANLVATDYGVKYGEQGNGLRGCFNSKTKQFDPGCKKCKEEKDKTGKNACYKVSGKIKLGALGTLNGLKDMMKETASFTQGNITTADLNAGNTEQLVARINKKRDQLLKSSKYGPTLKKVDKLQKKLGGQLSSRIKKGLASGSISNPFGSGLSAGNKATSAKDILKNLKNEIKLNKAKFGTGGTLAGGSKKPGMNDYNFGDTAGAGDINIGDVDNIMKKEYSFNDINNNSDNNIFKIITNRYHRSGLRRLFDDKGISKADKGNDTEINQK